jgi:abortive infection bacteriophage resistance protein
VGFIDFIKNVIHVRNFISHNIAIYNVGVRYVTPELSNMYEFIFKEKPTSFKFYHLIRLFGHFSNDQKLLQKTMTSLDLMDLKPEHKAQVLSLIK